MGVTVVNYPCTSLPASCNLRITQYLNPVAHSAQNLSRSFRMVDATKECADSADHIDPVGLQSCPTKGSGDSARELVGLIGHDSIYTRLHWLSGQRSSTIEKPPRCERLFRIDGSTRQQFNSGRASRCSRLYPIRASVLQLTRGRARASNISVGSSTDLSTRFDERTILAVINSQPTIHWSVQREPLYSRRLLGHCCLCV
jgi:hypothetical protein